ncbi:unnamed protein product (macronuclear) [Paramecium tetraurelia]|uniref:Peroxin-13 n=1 Tax=Paramecium tetraurelia TaxID=5888 RepID=A0DDE2_PARTE|nr:uncharacterized protein GSPATT00015918001 [Paramecium tetraurelia]CAK81059.1 unnamed protein product [Paramecium tetraurelia]|eukprot:XP_001448456.1 hypothetical protein (macronuclear) [Paramecium tetraurelia strain d4-2]
MPPKPWESQQRVQKATAITQELQQNQTINKSPDLQIQDTGIGEMTQEQAAQVSALAANSGTNNQTSYQIKKISISSLNNNLNSTTGLGYGGLNSYGGGYGGMGYGGMGGYGGYGGYSSGYGGGMGMGMGMGYGMGGYGMNRFGMGMGAGMQQGSKMMQALEYLDSVGFVVNSLCEIARMIEMNTQGLYNLGISGLALLGRLYTGNKWLWHVIINFIKKIYYQIKTFLLFENQTSNQINQKYKKLLIFGIIVSALLLSTLIYPKMVSNNSSNPILDQVFNQQKI